MTEGTKTEPQYFSGLARYLRATGVEVFGCGRDPVQVVQEAAKRAASAQRRDGVPERYDAVWCVFDVDEHTHLEEALREAGRRNISVAITNPCFEVWLLWHFADLRRHVSERELRRLLRAQGIEGKALPANFPFGLHEEAVRRSHQAALCQLGSIPQNPGSQVCEVVMALRAGSGHQSEHA